MHQNHRKALFTPVDVHRKDKDYMGNQIHAARITQETDFDRQRSTNCYVWPPPESAHQQLTKLWSGAATFRMKQSGPSKEVRRKGSVSVLSSRFSSSL